MSIIPEKFETKKASVYTNPKNNADSLPQVYGDLTDGTQGIWTLPLIDTVNFVYAYAGHETLSVANGNTVSIFVDGVLDGGVTFNEIDNLEGQGIVSTITFPADKGNAKITAKGKGKPTISSGTVLMDNPIDIINDVLIDSGFSASNYDLTTKSLSRQKAITLGYQAAGIITDDIKMWDLLQQILNSFNLPKTQTFINADGSLVLNINDNILDISAGQTIIPKAELNFVQAIQRIEDVLNRFTGLYQYNYVEKKFLNETVEVSDTLSENLFGTLKPATAFEFFWSRKNATITKVLNIILLQFKQPLWFVKAKDITLKRVFLDIGDIVVATIEDLYDETGQKLINQYFKIMSYNPDSSGLDLQLLDTGTFLDNTPLLDGSRLLDGSFTLGNNRDLTVF